MVDVPNVPKMPDINDIDTNDDIAKDPKPAAYNPFYESLDTVKNGFNEGFNSFKGIGNTGDNINSEDVKSVFNNKIYIGLLAVVVVSTVVAYLLYLYITGSVFNQSKVVINGTKNPVLCNKLSKIPINKFNKSGNGKRRTYTFWIYVHDLNKYKGIYKHVFHIGENKEIQNASPYIFLDKNENKLHVRFASNDEKPNVSHSSVQNMSDNDFSAFMKQGITVPYIPIQRWVHVAIVVNENSNGGNIIAYVDGDISKISTTGDNANNVEFSNLNLDKMGDLFVGGSFESLSGPGFSGLISKVTMFNYDLNNKDVYNDYNKGPLDGILAMLGLSNYGLRAPIYKIE